MSDGEYSWAQLPGEPDLWYHRFKTYYLGLGNARNLRQAFLMFQKEEVGKDIEGIASKDVGDGVWHKMNDKWDWRKRARQYDKDMMEQSKGKVQEAILNLQTAAPDAVRALVTSLANPRLAVAAANSILDRAGIPTQKKIDVTAEVFDFTADDMSAASEEVDSWEKQNFSNENG